MRSTNFIPPYSDEAIVAWLDGEMNDTDAQRFEQVLRSDDQLAVRIATLQKSDLAFKEAFAPLLDDAPQARMQHRLEQLLAETPAAGEASSSRIGVSRRSLIAASLSFLVIGSGLGYLARPASAFGSESEKIRDLEARYMSLYSAETLLDMDSASSVLARGLARTAQDIGLHLSEQQLAIQGAELKMVRMLRYDSTSIAQIAWMHADYGPMALCISPDRQQSATAINHEQRHGMHLAWWSAGGYQFVLIGRNPVSQLSDSALRLQASLT
ncbi:anti-sigma factor family protein [Dickeya dadantii subsp. dieffenbachiae]|uniref:anti-sigma factor family protein n=1 Tax=Dickeya dadantii TaxID=204038 RepID=UPI00039AE548|nr:membrane protein [Dickeya dadantii]